MKTQKSEDKQSIAKLATGVILFIIVLVATLVYLVYAIIEYGFPDKPDDTSPGTAAQESTSDQAPGDDEDSSLPPSSPTPKKHAGAKVSLANSADRVSFTLSGFDVRHVKLTINKVSQETNVLIPVGLAIGLQTDTNKATFLVRQPREIALAPSSEPLDFYLEVVCLSPDDFTVTFMNSPLSLATSADQELVHFLSQMSKAEAPWRLSQAGIWVLAINITSKKLHTCKITQPHPARPGEKYRGPIATFRDIKALKDIFSSMSLRPQDYRLFVDIDADVQDLLNRFNQRNDVVGIRALLSSKRPMDFIGSSRIENALISLARYSNDRQIRKLAMDNLFEMGMSASTQELLSKAKDHDLYTRFVASLALFRTGDPRGIPLLALHAEDHIFGPYINTTLSKRIETLTGTPKRPEESMYDYWVRAVGWEKLAKDTGEDMSGLKSAVEKIVPRPDPVMLRAIEDMGSDNTTTAQSACRHLRNFNREPRAFKALCDTAMNHKEMNVRSQAFYSLQAFRDFNPVEPCVNAMKGNDLTLAQRALDLAGSMDFDGADQVFALGFAHASPKIRREAVKCAGQHAVEGTEDTILKLARYDSDQYVRQEGITTLARMRSREGLKIVKGMLTSGDRSKKYQAMNCLSYWKDDKEVLSLLQRYKDDPDIGPRATSHLKRYGVTN